MFVWIDYGPAHPTVGPWVGEKVGGGWCCRSLDGGKTWDLDNESVCDAGSIRNCESRYTVTYIDEDHPRYGELCAMAMKAALTERN